MTKHQKLMLPKVFLYLIFVVISGRCISSHKYFRIFALLNKYVAFSLVPVFLKR